MSVLELQNIHRSFAEGVEVLRGVDLSVANGEVVGLLGRNGAGKTTLLRVAMGMLHPNQGSVSVFGMDPWKQPVEIKRRLGYVSEEQILPPYLRVQDLLAMHRELFPTWDDNVVDAQLFGHAKISKNAKISALSKGEARQVALLCAVAHHPELLLLDEPASGLDPVARRQFLETSVMLLNRDNSTIVFSSHNMADVERIASRIVLIHDGSVLLDDQVDTLRQDYSLAIVTPSAHIGIERVLQLEGCVRARQKGAVLHGVFSKEAASLESLLAEQLKSSDVRCIRLSLEELFIELVDGRS
jgi:ABC-2 type transport system ATP-binding protein